MVANDELAARASEKCAESIRPIEEMQRPGELVRAAPKHKHIHQFLGRDDSGHPADRSRERRKCGSRQERLGTFQQTVCAKSIAKRLPKSPAGNVRLYARG